MSWWQESFELVDGHLTQAISHVNAAHDALDASSSSTRICELYFHALNTLWNAHALHRGIAASADTPAFIALLQELSGNPDDLLRDPRVERLVSFTPAVLNHHALKTRGYRPGQAIDDRLEHAATEEHRKLRNAYARWLQDGATTDGLLKKFAEFLFVIRSNIAHGEKTPYGPDVAKARRDEAVSAVTHPSLELIVDHLLASPSRRLVSYGTLRPGEVNASVLADLTGQWTPCRIRGRLVQIDGLPGLIWDSRADEIEAMLFVSTSLSQRWDELDRFEGDRYRRRLVSVSTHEGPRIANVYEATSESPVVSTAVN